jgi:anti-sigma regulatory factor (Ser/Thr protein kinase)
LGLLLTKTDPVLLEEISLAVSLTEDGWSPGVAKYLGATPEVFGHETAASLEQVAGLCRHVQGGLDGSLRGWRRLRLVLDELLSNAIHHSPAGAAQLEWGRDATRHVFVVRDEAGTFSPAEALRLLDRHLRGEGLLDPRGRGLHLSRIYADRLYATTVPGKVTEIAAVFWNTPGIHEGFKPVWMMETKLSGRG